MKTKSTSDTDILDWTVSDAEFADAEVVEVLDDSAEPPAAQPTTQPLRFNWKMARAATFLLVGASITGLMLLAAYTAWQNYTLRQTLTPLVIAEDEARLKGDVDALREFLDDDDTAWQYDQMALGQTFPTALAWPLPEAGEVQTVERFGPELVRVEVLRPYSNQADYGYYGPLLNRPAAYAFIQPQFYRWQKETWKRVRVPDEYFGERQEIASGRLTWKFPAVDRDWVEAVRPTVERTLNAACGLWACPAEFGLTVIFITRTVQSNWNYPYPPTSEDSLVLSYYQADNGAIYGSHSLITQSPHLVGWPADAATETFFAESLSLRVLATALYHLNLERVENRNLLWMALAGRLLTRFEFENPRYRELIAPEPLTPLEELWATHAQRNFGSLAPQLRDAQIILNRLLKTLPPEAEQLLFVTMPAAQDPTDWLVKALDVSPAEAAELWRAALTPVAVAPQATEPAKFALLCPATTGLALWDGGEAAPYAALPPSTASATPVSWSPDGQKLVVRTGTFANQMGVVDFAARRVTWLPKSGGWPNAQWLSNTRLVYTISSELQFTSAYDPGQTQLALFDTERPAEAPVLIPHIHSFIIAPNREQIAVMGLPPGATGDRLGLLAAESGEVRWLDEGSGALWTADSQQLVYTSFNTKPLLKLVDTKTEIIRVLLNPEIIKPLLPLTFTVQSLNALAIEDDYLYFAAFGDQSAYSGSTTFLGRVRLDGSGLQKLFLATQAWANFMGVFEDESYFLMAAQSYLDNQSTFLVVETATGNVARTIEGYTQLWYNLVPPNSARVMLVNGQGEVFSLREPFGPLEPYVSPAVISGCGEVVQNPAFGGP